MLKECHIQRERKKKKYFADSTCLSDLATPCQKKTRNWRAPFPLPLLSEKNRNFLTSPPPLVRKNSEIMLEEAGIGLKRPEIAGKGWNMLEWAEIYWMRQA